MKILITGGTGTFGTAFIKKILKENNHDEIIVFSRDEYKQYTMREELKSERIKYVIGDIRHFDSINASMHGVDYVFHAAAMKHVRSCEENPMEAILTNVIGTKNVIESAIANNAQKVVVLSTDKAVCPKNTMGMTKALAEKIAIDYSTKSSTKIAITRFGNLMMSRGSVLEKFISLAQKGKELTVTSEHMERFMMSIDDAIDLISYAFSSPSNGHIFVKKAKVFNILKLAEAVNDLYENKTPIRLLNNSEFNEKEVEMLLFNETAVDRGNFYEIDPYGKEGERMTVSSENQIKETKESIKEILMKMKV